MPRNLLLLLAALCAVVVIVGLFGSSPVNVAAIVLGGAFGFAFFLMGRRH